MRLTRLIALSLAAVLALGTPAAWAQFGPIQSGGVIASTTGSGAVNASGQVSTAQTFLTHTVGTALVLNAPVRIVSRGYLSTASSSAGTITVTVAFGAISLTPVSAVNLTAGLLETPYFLECEAVPTTASTASTYGYTKELVCEFGYQTSGGAGAASTVTRYVRRTTGTISATTTQAITATVTFSDVTVNTGLIAQGNQVLQGY